MGPSSVESTYSLAEDPVIWFSGGKYHVLYDYPDDRVGYHLTSTDGIHDWTDEGLAYDPRYAQQIFSYTDGTVDHWYKMERPNVVIENGLITHVTFAVSDVDKNNQIAAGTNHGSKVIVVPFDGVTFDKDTGVGTGRCGAGGNHGTGGAAGGGGESAVTAALEEPRREQAGRRARRQGEGAVEARLAQAARRRREVSAEAPAAVTAGLAPVVVCGAPARAGLQRPALAVSQERTGEPRGEGATSSGCTCSVTDARASSHGGRDLWFMVGLALTVVIARRPRGARRPLGRSAYSKTVRSAGPWLIGRDHVA